MAYAGSRTKNTDVWLLPEDERAFDAMLHDGFPEAAWRCDQPGPAGLHPYHRHPALEQALACGRNGAQAFLELPVGAGLPSGAAAVQFLRTRQGHGPGGIRCEHPAELRGDCDAFLNAGRLAVSWFENEVDAATHRLLLDQTREVWSALTAATHPARIRDARGKRLTGLRIGAAALAAGRATGMPLGRTRERFQLI